MVNVLVKTTLGGDNVMSAEQITGVTLKQINATVSTFSMKCFFKFLSIHSLKLFIIYSFENKN